VEAPAVTDFHRARVVQGAPEAGPSPHYYLGVSRTVGERVTHTDGCPEI